MRDIQSIRHDIKRLFEEVNQMSTGNTGLEVVTKYLGLAEYELEMYLLERDQTRPYKRGRYLKDGVWVEITPYNEKELEREAGI